MVDYVALYQSYQDTIKENQGELEFKWMKPSELTLIENYKKTAWEDNTNPYLQKFVGNKPGLVEDMMTNGSIYPMFVKYDAETGRHYVILGNHRKKAMDLYEIENGSIANKFLCIVLPESHFVDGGFGTTGEFIRMMRWLTSSINAEIINNVDFVPFEGFNDETALSAWLAE